MHACEATCDLLHGVEEAVKGKEAESGSTLDDGWLLSVQSFIYTPMLAKVFCMLDQWSSGVVPLATAVRMKIWAKLLLLRLILSTDLLFPAPTSSPIFSIIKESSCIIFSPTLSSKFQFSYICAKVFWASSPTLSFSAISSTSNCSQTQKKSPWLVVQVSSSVRGRIKCISHISYQAK